VPALQHHFSQACIKNVACRKVLTAAQDLNLKTVFLMTLFSLSKSKHEDKISQIVPVIVILMFTIL